MKRGILSLKKIRAMRKISGRCPVCGGPLFWNLNQQVYGQWAHLLCNTKPHRRRYGAAVIDSEYNGFVVCSLRCNNAVQLNRKSQPILCDRLADEIRKKVEEDNLVLNRD